MKTLDKEVADRLNELRVPFDQVKNDATFARKLFSGETLVVRDNGEFIDCYFLALDCE